MKHTTVFNLICLFTWLIPNLCLADLPPCTCDAARFKPEYYVIPNVSLFVCMRSGCTNGAGKICKQINYVTLGDSSDGHTPVGHSDNGFRDDKPVALEFCMNQFKFLNGLNERSLDLNK